LDRRVITRDNFGANGHNGLNGQFNDRASGFPLSSRPP
jgi:hypothetical protein